jgi:hypothetical protein
MCQIKTDMPTFFITYDLIGGDSSDYEELYKAIKAYGTWARVTESTWAVVTDEDASTVRSDLMQHMHEDDRLFVLKSGSAAAWHNVRCRTAWLKKWL